MSDLYDDLDQKLYIHRERARETGERKRMRAKREKLEQDVIRGFAYCVGRQKRDAVAYFLERQLDSLDPEELDAAFCNALLVKDAETVRALLKHARVCPPEQSFVLSTSQHHASTEIVDLLLEDGRADPGWSNNKAVLKAALCGNVEIAELLMGHVQLTNTQRCLVLFHVGVARYTGASSMIWLVCVFPLLLFAFLKACGN